VDGDREGKYSTPGLEASAWLLEAGRVVMRGTDRSGLEEEEAMLIVGIRENGRYAESSPVGK
jgi:hypothetical protein